MKSRAAVAWESGKPLTIEEVEVGAPKTGEVLLKVVASGVCHTDAYTLSGKDPEGLFPAIMGHEGGATVMEVGAGVTSVKPNDHVHGHGEGLRAYPTVPGLISLNARFR